LSDKRPRLLIVSDQLPRFELLIQAAKENVVVVPVQFASWDIAKLEEAIKMRAGKPKKQKCEIVRAARRAYLPKQSSFLIHQYQSNFHYQLILATDQICFIINREKKK